MAQPEEDEDIGSDPEWDDLADDGVSDVDTDDVDLDDLNDEVEASKPSQSAVADSNVDVVAHAAPSPDLTNQVAANDAKETEAAPFEETSAAMPASVPASVSEIQPIDSPVDQAPINEEREPVVSNQTQQSSNTWSWGAAWSTISAAIQEDVQDLTTTFQRAIDNVKEEIRTPLEQDEVDEDAQNDGDGAASNSTRAMGLTERETDQELEDGLQAIDEQVEKLAGGAVSALGSLWSGLGGAINSGLTTAGNVASRMEHAALQAASTVIERVEAPRGSSTSSPQRSRHGPGAGAWDLLRRVGQMFEGADNPYGYADASGLSEDDWDMIHHLDAPENAASVSFEQLFKVYRGHRFEEDLEEFGNEAAKECNRTRATLSAARKAELDATMALLAGVVDLSAHLPPSSSPRASNAATLELISGIVPSCNSTVAPNDEDAAYAALAGLCTAAVQRARQMGDRAAASLQQTLAMDATALDADEGEGMEVIHAAWGELQDKVFLIRSEGLKLLAEFTSLALQHLIMLASSLRETSDDGREPEHAVSWPAGDAEKGALVRASIQQLLADLCAISAAFCDALLLVGKHKALGKSPQQAPDGPPAGAEALSTSEASGQAEPSIPPTVAEWSTQLASVVESLVTGLRADTSDACDKLIVASKHLMYPVCVACVRHLTAPKAPTPAPTNESSAPPTTIAPESAPAAPTIASNNSAVADAAETAPEAGTSKDAKAVAADAEKAAAVAVPVPDATEHDTQPPSESDVAAEAGASPAAGEEVKAEASA